MRSIRRLRLGDGRNTGPLLFIADLATIESADEQQLGTTLDDAERQRRDALDHDRAQRLFAVSHGLMRHAAASCLGLPLDQVRIDGEIGMKPRLSHPAAALDLSMSHSGGLAACAVTTSGCIGVDLEAPRPGRPLRIAPMLAPEEQAWLARCGPEPHDALAVWTLKEAVAKAIGQGLRLDFASFAVAVDPPSMLRPPPEHAGNWRLWQMTIAAAPLAVAWLDQ